MSTVLAVVGPLLAAIGATLLAYDVLTNPGRAQRREANRKAGERWATFYKTFYDKFKDAPVASVREIAEEYGRLAAEAPERRSEGTRLFEASHVETSRAYGVTGLVLIAVGSLMQSAAVLLTP